MVRIFSFGERWNVPFNSAVALLNGTFHLSPHENILTIALINIHYLYNVCHITLVNLGHCLLHIRLLVSHPKLSPNFMQAGLSLPLSHY